MRENKKILTKRLLRFTQKGQAFTEYGLILVIVAVGLAAILAATGPAIGNVFSNTVANLLQMTPPRATLSEAQFWETITAIASITPEGYTYKTNTPAPPTATGSPVPTLTPIPPTEVPTDTVEPTEGPSPTPLFKEWDIPFYENFENGVDNWFHSFENPDTRYPGWPDDPTGYDDCEWGEMPPTDGISWYNPNDSWKNTVEERSYSPSSSVAISRGNDYDHNTYCPFELRGEVDLTGVFEEDEPPVLQFYDRWRIEANDYAYLQVRRSTETWADAQTITLHGSDLGRDEQWGWTLEQFRLDDFNNGGTLGAGEDYTGSKIRFRFVLETDNSGANRGWMIDDVTIKRLSTPITSIPYFDRMDNANRWLTTCGWTLASEEDIANVSQQYLDKWENVYSPPTSLNDSVGKNYDKNSDCSATSSLRFNLNGTIDPEMVLWHRYSVDWSDLLVVEVSPDNGFTWESILPDSTLPQQAFAEGYIPKMTTWVREVFSLQPWIGENIQVRFRIWADSNGDTDPGWMIDDLEIREKPEPELTYPFFDGAESDTGNWIMEGEWGISPREAYEGTHSFTDSPEYQDTNGNWKCNYTEGGSMTSMQTISSISLADAIDPVFIFYAAWELGGDDWAIAEVSTDGGATWTEVWSAYETDNYSFTRIQYDLAANIGDAITLRFRVDARDSTGDNDCGLWIDNVSVQERPNVELTFPFYDDMESGNDFWITSGRWQITSEKGPSPADNGEHYWSDSPASSGDDEYYDNSDYAIELKGNLDMAGAVMPVLIWWDQYEFNSIDSGIVEISTDNGNNWTELFRHFWTYSETWQRHMVDLSDYANQIIKIRFRLVSDSWSDDDGWYIDDIEIKDYTPRLYQLPLFDGAESQSLSPRWIGEGDWGVQGRWPHTGAFTFVSNFNDENGNNWYSYYNHRDNAALQLDGLLDLSNTTSPGVSWNDIWYIGTGDFGYVDVSLDGGYTWYPIFQREGWSKGLDGENHWDHRDDPTQWYLGQANLEPFVSNGTLGIRFRLDARVDWSRGTGWYIDNILIAD